MYVVRRAFRNYGQMMVPGSVVEPGSIKRFKSRLNDGKIVEVTEQNFNKWDKYFRERLCTPILLPEAKTEEVGTEEVKTEEVKTEEVKTEAVKKVVVKPASK